MKRNLAVFAGEKGEPLWDLLFGNVFAKEQTSNREGGTGVKSVLSIPLFNSSLTASEFL